ncbi:Putative clathrin assembly protein [Apostasia shenzhenica]|uniref:Clathrin assembly protein n=1 Tax=Apostasia shenzhenica TaxID=1088818 RepID=A0A2I0BG11_9ASPA|nr:Putative clathrin assembly protein [Apostasia shenzhenica]
MKIKFSKLSEAVTSLKQPLARMSKAAVAGGNILSDIEVAIVRSTVYGDQHLPDDRYVNEILFLVSNAPGSITFLARRLSAAIGAAGDSAVALKALALLHRLLRGGDRFFEQDLRILWFSGELRISPRCRSPSVVGYSSFLHERIQWLINQSGKLEPARPPPGDAQAREGEAKELVMYKVSRCQSLLDRVMNCSPEQSRVGLFAFGIVVRESFRVYESFSDGLDILYSSFFALKRSARFSALEIFRKACIQTPKLSEFFDRCKRIITESKNMGYPSVRVITEEEVSALEETMKKNNAETEEAREGGGGGWRRPFSEKLETKISTVWVEFDDGDSEASSMISMAGFDDRSTDVGSDLLLAEGVSSKSNEAMVFL